MSGTNHPTRSLDWTPSTSTSNTNRAPLFPWEANPADAHELPLRDPELGLTYLRRREAHERQHGIEQFLRFANRAAPLHSTLNADSEYSAASGGLGRGAWPGIDVAPEEGFDATIRRLEQGGERYPVENVHGDEWAGMAGGELMGESWGWDADMMDEDGEGEVADEFEVGEWGEGDDEEEDDQLREAMMELARSTNRTEPAYEDAWTSEGLDDHDPARELSAVELANRNAAAAERNLRRTYGLDATQDPWATNYYDYLGSRPLNPPADPPEGYEARPSVTRPSMFDLLEDRAKTRRVASDPCSATSWCSYLAPGMKLAGVQVFAASSSDNLAESQRMNRSHARSGNDSPSDYAARASALRTAYAPLPAQLRSTPATVPLVHPPPGQPTAAPGTSAQSETTDPTIPRLRELGRRPPAFESLLAVLREDVRDPSRPERFSDFASRVNLDVAALASAAMDDQGAAKAERWSVEVTVLSYDPAKRRMSGLMHALGFAGQAEPPTITTYLRGEILVPGVEGLWTPGSAKALPLTEWGVKRAAQVGRHWAGIGPFKDVGREELSRKAADLKWLRRKTDGWILMRWKETGFVNVSSKCSPSA